MKNERFDSLDLLRAGAALAVFAYHGTTETLTGEVPFYRPLAESGDLGVFLFYLLSGFLITYSLDQIEAKMPGASFFEKALSFWRRRALRVYPLYLFSIGVILLLDSSIRASMTTGNLLSHLFGTHIFYREYHGAINGVLWTLGIEIQFYVLAPFLYLIFRKRKDYEILLLALALWAVSYGVFRFLFIEQWGAWSVETGKPDHWAYFMGLNQLPNVLIFFALGSLAYRRRGLPVSWVLAFIALGTIILLPYISPFLSRELTLLNGPYAFRYCQLLLYGLLFYGVLRFFANKDFQQGFGKYLCLPFAWIGQISFGFYIWHLVVMRLVFSTLPATSATLKIGISFAISMIIADFLYRYLEIPFLKRKVRLG
ncbi:MAG: acyltransferase [Haliea sp.]|nr:acyltransferase [Haliea sp.]